MKKFWLFFLLLNTLACMLFAQDVSFEWAKQFKGIATGNSTGYSEGISIIVDQTGNIYTIGMFNGTVDFDPERTSRQLTSSIRSKMYIHKMDAQGQLIWVKSIGGKRDIFALSVDSDLSGNLYITGRFTDSVDFDPGNGSHYLHAIAFDAFILKLDPNGELVWVRQLKGQSNCIGESIALGAENNIYLGGTFIGETDFDQGRGTDLLSPKQYKDIFILKLDSNGEMIWVKQFENYISSSVGNKNINITVDSIGNVYSAGVFMDSTDFDPSNDTFLLESHGFGSDIFLCKLNKHGNFVWAKSIGGHGYELVRSINLDELGNMVYSGIFNDSVDFDPGNGSYNLFSSVQDNNLLFISKLDTSGNFIWAKQSGGWNAYTQSFDKNMLIDKMGAIYISGTYIHKTDFDPGPDTFFLDSQNENVYFSKLNSLGKHIWTKHFRSIGTLGYNHGSSIALDNLGNIYSTGRFVDSADFDSGDSTFLMVSSHYDTFVHKLNQCNSRSTESITACKEFTWNGNIYKKSGIYYDTIPNSIGCDSLMQLQLKIIEIDNGIEMDYPTLKAKAENSEYQWVNCSNGKISIEGETEQDFTAKLNGSYAVIITKDNCSDTSECYQISGIAKDFYIFPNPTQGNFEIIFEKELVNARLSLMDARERLVWEIEGFNGRRIKLSLANQASGLYFITVNSNGEIQRGKIVKCKL